MASAGNLRPSMTKPNSEGVNDGKKTHVSVVVLNFWWKDGILFFIIKKYVSEWEIRPEDVLSHGRMVGRGTYGTVYKAEVRLHGMNN